MAFECVYWERQEIECGIIYFEYELFTVVQSQLLFQIIAFLYVDTILGNSLFIRYLLFTISYSLFVIRYLLFANRLLFTLHYMLFDI